MSRFVVFATCALLFATCQPRPSLEGGRWAAPLPDPDAASEAKSVEDKLAALNDQGVRFRPAPVAKTTTGKGVTCEMPDGIRVMRGGSGARYSKPPHVNTAFALRLTRFEQILQEEAAKWFGQPIKRIEHLGSYVCRHVAGTAGTLSEHAHGNAIDVSGFVLKNGTRLDVTRDYARAGREPQRAAEHFFRDLVARLRAERTFSVILTPDWDKKHHNHLHLDGSRRFSIWRLLS